MGRIVKEHPTVPDLRLQIGPDAMLAVLSIPARYPRQDLSLEACTNLLSENQIAITPQVYAAVEEAIASAMTDETEDVLVKLHGQAPQDGVDGRIEWAPEVQAAQTVCRNMPTNVERPTDKRVDYYNCSPYLPVGPDQVIATIHPPTEAIDGVDLRGNTVPAKSGNAVDLQMNESIHVDSEGRCISQIAGVLLLNDQSMRVTDHLRIEGNIDFSTGNINANCDVEVGGGVGDRFVIRCRKNVCVHGLIEAAVIECDGDFEALGGMAAKEKGRVQIGGDQRARYLNNVMGTVKGDLIVDREIINCTMQIGGRLLMPRGTFAGSRLDVRREAHLGVLGAASGERTYIALGSWPLLESCLSKTKLLMQELEKKIAPITERLGALESAKAHRVASLKQEMSDLAAKKADLDSRRARLFAKHRQALDHHHARRRIELRVDSIIHPGALVRVDDDVVRFDTPLKGPLIISRDTRGDLICTEVGSNASMLLKRVARIMPFQPSMLED